MINEFKIIPKKSENCVYITIQLTEDGLKSMLKSIEKN